MEKKLRISFIIPFTEMTGGIAVVLEYRRCLTAMGHDVDIYYPLLPYRGLLYPTPLWKKVPVWILRLLSNIKRGARAISLFSEEIPVKPVLRIHDGSIPDADAVIATAWPTAYDVVRLSPAKGRKFYFVQHYETWSGRESSVDGSYRLPIEIITIAPWLTKLMGEKFGRGDVTEIHNGIRLDKFYPPEVKDFSRASILMMAHELAWKGSRDGIEALTVIKERYPYAEIRMFGMCPRPDAPFDFEYHRDPSYEKLLALYQDAAIFLSPSHKEGWHLPPMEAMACKCALAATNVGCIPTLNDGENMVLTEAGVPSSIVEGVSRLLDDRALLERTAEKGFARVRKQEWARAAQALAQTLADSPR
jgi:hypothetical protein